MPWCVGSVGTMPHRSAGRMSRLRDGVPDPEGMKFRTPHSSRAAAEGCGSFRRDPGQPSVSPAPPQPPPQPPAHSARPQEAATPSRFLWFLPPRQIQRIQHAQRCGPIRSTASGLVACGIFGL